MWLTIDEQGKGGINSKMKLSTQESAALQMFPRNYKWPKKKTPALRQIGNSVPPEIARLLLSNMAELGLGAAE